MYMLRFLYIILFILFIFYFFNFEDDTDIETKEEKKVIITKTSNSNDVFENNTSTNLKIKEPQFRGIYDYHKIDDKNENGGSDPFKNNNINIIDTTNEVNYNKYDSYRKKPIMGV